MKSQVVSFYFIRVCLYTFLKTKLIIVYKKTFNLFILWRFGDHAFTWQRCSDLELEDERSLVFM